MTRVTWTVYAKDDTSIPDTDRMKGLDESFNSALELQAYQLLEVATRSRARGIHTLFDPTDMVIWTFGLHDANGANPEDNENNDEATQLMKNYGLTGNVILYKA